MWIMGNHSSMQHVRGGLEEKGRGEGGLPKKLTQENSGWKRSRSEDNEKIQVLKEHGFIYKESIYT